MQTLINPQDMLTPPQALASPAASGSRGKPSLIFVPGATSLDMLQVSPGIVDAHMKEQQGITVQRSDKFWQPHHNILALSLWQAANFLDSRSDQQIWASISCNRESPRTVCHSTCPSSVAVWLKFSWLKCFVGHSSHVIMCNEGTGPHL